MGRNNRRIQQACADRPLAPSPRCSSERDDGTRTATGRAVLRSYPKRSTRALRRRRAVHRLFTYPDISVACEPKFREPNGRTLLNPVLLIEVLSDSTEIYDRTTKVESYQTPGLFADLVGPDARRDGQGWRLTSASQPYDSLDVASCGCRLEGAHIYRKSSFRRGRSSSAGGEP
jgi:Putative restriction endonuclease